MLTSAFGSIENGLARLTPDAIDTNTNTNHRSVAVRECTSCGIRFDASSCPNCSSEIWRTKTMVSHASVSLLLVLITTSVGVLRRIATGQLTSDD